jgi:uncharacterized damage-inducible protein DinB
VSAKRCDEISYPTTFLNVAMTNHTHSIPEEIVMSANALLQRMFRYQAWANVEMLQAVQGLDPEQHAEPRHQALRMMNHCLVVNRIFVAHLLGEPHGYTAGNTPDTPTLEALLSDHAAVDRWYLDYLATVTVAELAESLAFAFTDGDKGYMTREEMLTHVVTHNTYHRGEVGRILKQVAVSMPDLAMPWDTYAVHLHSTEPARRHQGKGVTAVA